jgi:hypothetical protein
VSAAAHRAAGERAVRWARNALTVLVVLWALTVVATGLLAASTDAADVRALVAHMRRSETMFELVVAREDAMLFAACALAVPVLLAVCGDVLTRRAHEVVRQDVPQRVSPLSMGAVTVAVFVVPSLLGAVAGSAAGPQGSEALSWVGLWPYVALVPAMVVWHHCERAPDLARAAALARETR